MFRSARSRRNPRHEVSYASLADAAIAVRRERLVRSLGGGDPRAGARVHRAAAGGGARGRARPRALRARRDLDRPPPRAPATLTGHHLRAAELVGTAGSLARRGRRAGVEERTVAGLQAAQPPRRGADRRGVSGGDEHRPIAPGDAKLFEGHIGKDIVSRAWQRTRAVWEAWQKRDRADEDSVI